MLLHARDPVAVTHPEAPFASQHAEKQLQLLHRDAVTGKDPQHVHEQIFKRETKHRPPTEKGHATSVQLLMLQRWECLWRFLL